MHATVSGCGDNLAADDEDALDQARLVQRYFPSRGATCRPIEPRPPAHEPWPTWCRPRSTSPTTSTTSSTRSSTRSRSSNGCRSSPRAGHGLALLDGRPVGVVANNPMAKGGVLFVDSADKAARFIWLCDAFNIPLVFLADVPGFMVGTEADVDIIRHGAGWSRP